MCFIKGVFLNLIFCIIAVLNFNFLNIDFELFQ
jgi:hypothetical protein